MEFVAAESASRRQMLVPWDTVRDEALIHWRRRIVGGHGSTPYGHTRVETVICYTFTDGHGEGEGEWGLVNHELY